MIQHGVSRHRALAQEYVSRSAFANPGAFGRMFPTAPTFEFGHDLLRALNDKMLADSSPPNPPGGLPNETVPAGYTFLGQFVDHDITFDPTSSLEQQNDPEAIHNFRTPLLELDSVYGAGPDASPHLYDQRDSAKLLVTGDGDRERNDLPRNAQGTALIGDPRNDENLIVSQLHLAFLKFHNSVVDHIRPHVPADDVFREAQRTVRWHYQWIVVHEFLTRIVGPELVAQLLSHELGTAGGQDPIGNVLDSTLRFFRYKEEPFIPVEFAVAAYRFGHSMVRAGYGINLGFGALLFPPGSRDPNPPPEFRSLHTPRNLAGDPPALRTDPVRTVDWTAFFELEGETTPPGQTLPPGPLPQRSMRMDATMSPSLFDLPAIPEDGSRGPVSLVLRNLIRGETFRLPYGQAVAAAMGVEPLGDDVLGLTDLGFPPERAPLWYYVLKEAEVQHEGSHLGQVGGRIVAEVLLGLLHGDPNSYLSLDPRWDPSRALTPAPPLTDTPGKFTVADLLRFAGVADPPVVPPPPTPPDGDGATDGNGTMPAEPETSGQPRMYVVQSGDTLRAIAARFLGAEGLWPLIFEANLDKIQNPDLIFPDQELVIPA